MDRDGVINRAIVRDGKPHPPADLKALEILPGVADAMQLLHESGWLLIVVTNQPDVARGMARLADEWDRCVAVEEENDDGRS